MYVESPYSNQAGENQAQVTLPGKPWHWQYKGSPISYINPSTEINVQEPRAAMLPFTSGTNAPSMRPPIRPHRLPNLRSPSRQRKRAVTSDDSATGIETRNEVEGGEGTCGRTAVRESAVADEPLHSSTVTHVPAAASPSGCDVSIFPLPRCPPTAGIAGWIGWSLGVGGQRDACRRAAAADPLKPKRPVTFRAARTPAVQQSSGRWSRVDLGEVGSGVWRLGLGPRTAGCLAAA
nr:unnamed protein product [Digitaria exilis]